jgi:hypothetical protein
MLRSTLGFLFFIARSDSFALRPAPYLSTAPLVHHSTPLKAAKDEELPLYEGLNHVGVIVSDTASAVSW